MHLFDLAIPKHCAHSETPCSGETLCRYVCCQQGHFACRYRAPECLLTDGVYGYKMDMWSVGCVMYEVLRYVWGCG